MTKTLSDDQIISIPCQNPKCKTVIKENFGWVKSNKTIQCQDCGFEMELEGLVKGIEETFQELGDTWEKNDPNIEL